MSLKGKNTKSIKRKDLPNSRRNVTGIKSVKFHHQASAGEIIIDITSLVAPAGFVNPLPSTLAQLRLKSFSENLVLLSSAKGTLMEGVTLSYTHQDEVTLKLNFEADEGEIFTGVFFNHQINGTLIADVRTPSASGELLEDQTDFNLGEAIPISDLTNQWPIQVFRGDKPMLRNVGNAEFAGDHSVGNYQMVDSGDGNCQVIRFNIEGDVDNEDIFWASHGALAERPDLSVLQQVDALNGILDLMKDDLLETTGFDVTDPNRYAGVPTNIDLKTFGDRVLQLEKLLNIEVLSGKQEYTLVQNGSSLLNLLNEVQFNLATATIINLFNPIISAVDDTPSTRTKFIASSLCKVDISWSFRSSAGERLYIYKNGAVLIDGDQNAAGESMSSGASMILQPGEFFSVGSNSSVQNSAVPTTVNFTAISIAKLSDLI